MKSISVRLSHDCTMSEILKVYQQFIDQYQASSDQIFLEDVSERCQYQCDDSYGCPHCEFGYVGYNQLTYSS